MTELRFLTPAEEQLLSIDNKLYGAAVLAEVEDCIRTVQRIIGLPIGETPLRDHMPDRVEWIRMKAPRRLQYIAKWLSAEIFRMADACEGYVRMDDPINTVGTRD